MIQPLIAQNIEMLVCPTCDGSLQVPNGSHSLTCATCGGCFATEAGIPLFFRPTDGDPSTDVTGVVKAFYEDSPFPDFEDVDSAWSLREKARLGSFALLRDEQVPLGAKILDAGCETGQLSNFLGMKWGRTVYGADASLSSLRLGQRGR